MSERNNELSCPPEILDWIPWYAEDALAETQRGAVEAHAAQCEECRKELAMLSGGPDHSAVQHALVTAHQRWLAARG